MTKKKFRVGNQISFYWGRDIHTGTILERSYYKYYKQTKEGFEDEMRIRKGYFTVKDSIDGVLRVLHENHLWIEEKVVYT